MSASDNAQTTMRGKTTGNISVLSCSFVLFFRFIMYCACVRVPRCLPNPAALAFPFISSYLHSIHDSPGPLKQLLSVTISPMSANLEMCNFRFFCCYASKRTTTHTHTIHINVETNILLPHNSAQFILRRYIKRMLCIRTHT